MPLLAPDIIVPTWNNEQYLIPFLNSIMASRNSYPFRLILVNNGDPALKTVIPDSPFIKFVQAPDNLGWEGGLKLGLEHSDAEFVGFLNDDLHFPVSSSGWLRDMMSLFRYPNVGAVGPTSNCVMGSQAIWHNIPREYHPTNILVGFCLLLRREALDKAGGIDDDLPGGDDIDLSIRLREAGYDLIIDRKVFVYHHGFKTGERVNGGADQVGGWNSQEMTDRTNNALIRKHGFRKWYQTIYFQPDSFMKDPPMDIEGDVIREWVSGRVLELGCGAQKTVPDSIGVDFYGKGEIIPTINAVSVADVKASVLDIPQNIGKFETIIARHILEHLTDTLEVLKYWASFLSPNGKLILAVPDDRLIDSIPLNPEHRHVFEKKSLQNILHACNLECETMVDSGNGVSFVTVAKEKVYINGVAQCV